MAAGGGDDQNQWHSGRCSDPIGIYNVQWIVPTRYQDLTYVGHGAFGVVMRATDTRANKEVAIKKLLHPFDSAEHAKRTYRELRLLQHVNHSDGQVVQLYNVFTPDRTLKEFNTLYFVFNFVDSDLHTVIDQKTSLTEEDIQKMICFLLRGLNFLHSAGIIHRDIKPNNIGISKKKDITILDLGLARVDSNGLHTGKVTNLRWRAPEAIVNPKRYDKKIDIWSVGCIMAELIRLNPLFPETGSIGDQVGRIIDITGTPTEQELKELCGEQALTYILREKPKVVGQDFHTLFPRLSEDGIDFLQSLLQFNPAKRPTAAEALNHPYLAPFHGFYTEPSVIPIDGPHEDAPFSVEQWKELTWHLVQGFTPPVWALTPAIVGSP